MKTLIVALTLALAACAPPPPNLTPQATQAFHNHQVQDALDRVRDIVQDGNALNPPMFSSATARLVTNWHESAIKVINTLGEGWKKSVETSLDELMSNLPPNEQKQLLPYVTLAKALIDEVGQ